MFFGCFKDVCARECVCVFVLALAAFNKNSEAMSVVDLSHRFKDKMDKVTVYRILDRLESSGILHSFMGKDGIKRYAKSKEKDIPLTNLQIHPHFLCTECGNSSCLPIKVSIPTFADYLIESAEQLLIGKCKDCYS